PALARRPTRIVDGALLDVGGGFRLVRGPLTGLFSSGAECAQLHSLRLGDRRVGRESTHVTQSAYRDRRIEGCRGDVAPRETPPTPSLGSQGEQSSPLRRTPPPPLSRSPTPPPPRPRPSSTRRAVTISRCASPSSPVVWRASPTSRPSSTARA